MILKTDFPYSVILTSKNHTIDNFKTAKRCLVWNVCSQLQTAKAVSRVNFLRRKAAVLNSK